MPDPERYFAAAEATWAPAEKIELGAVTLRRSPGGGKRVTAATARDGVTTQDILEAEARMRGFGQQPLFQLRGDQMALDQMLEAGGYAVADPTRILACPIDRVADLQHDREQSCLAVWEPLAIQLEFWANGGVGPDRIAVMERSAEPKTALIGRFVNSPGGTAFVAVSGGIGMLHALEIISASRRHGMGRAMTIQAAQWARAQGADTFALLCVESNVAANALYSGLGMDPVGRYHYRIKEG
ncbi:GNAT family N-acetyltransferase [Pseudooceanicola sp. C21-150M6]|uniref:GNAT family N-acetyltransferase n=1 Tax=Pseudooceanicola sp. C21-150M6 TaxID=3434355 RepID=UPI003D7FD1D7